VNAGKLAAFTPEADHDSPVFSRPCFDATAVHAEPVRYAVPEKTNPPNKAMQNNARSSLVFDRWLYAHGCLVFGGRV
jgi:hypothetical protein